jgi:hypothetical protein
MKDYLEYDILDSSADIKPLKQALPKEKGANSVTKKYTDDEVLSEYIDMLDLSRKVSMKQVAEKIGIQSNEIQDRLNQPQYRYVLLSKLQQILDVGRLMWLHNIMMEGIENPSNVGLARVLSPLLGFTTDKTMNLNLQAQIDAQRDNIPETPEEKQEYIAGILIDTGFTPERYEALYNERMFGR